MKVGRNDPCPCGSGKKYKRCHLLAEILDMTGMFQKENFEHNGLLIGRPVISTEFKGHRVVAVGSRLYHGLPENITFHEFLIKFLKDIIGQSWGLEESKKSAEEQHVIVRWIREMSELLGGQLSQMEDLVRDIRSVEASGNVQSLISLAYDIYSIYHCTDLPEDLVSRLKNSDQFQGAKYEVAVAGIFARAGFNLKWLSNKIGKQGEFIATHKDTGEMITVEAKSRHREGVLNRPGQMDDFEEMRADVGHLFNRALLKPDEGNPFMIFIDINLPLTKSENPLQRRWVDDIKGVLDQHPIGTLDNPDPFSALFITNFSWHYHGKGVGINKGETLTIIPRYPRIRTRDQNTVSLLHRATEQYGTVPPMFPEDKII